MGVDSSTILRDTAQDIVNGLNQDGIPALADMVCTRKERSALKGLEPYRPTVDTLPRIITAQAPGSDLRDRTFQLASLEWDMGQFDEKFEIVDSELEDLDQYLDSTLQRYIETVRRDVNLGIDSALKALLEAETNTKAVGNGAWDVSTSTPIADLQDGIKANVPGADLLIIGAQTALDLSRHPDFNVQSAHYESGASLGMGNQYAALRSALEALLGISASNIYVAGVFHNSANPGQSYNLAHLFDDFAWAGYREGLVMVEQKSSQQIYTNRVMNVQEMGYVRTLDMIRFDDGLGVEFTGTGT